MRTTRLFIAIVALAMVTPTALAYHRSVGGDIHVSFPPAEETGGPDVTGDYAVAQDRELIGGQMHYDNTRDDALAAQYDRVSPPDQVINHPAIGYFDVVDLQYAGAFQLSWFDPVAEDDHDITYSPNFHYQLPDPATVPGVGGPNTGVVYPTMTYWYAYLFGDGTATDSAGVDLTADHPSYDGLIDPSDCTGTARCQLLRPADLQAITSSEQKSAICGWVPVFHWHPSASLGDCRDFDFGYVSDNVDDLGGQNQPESPTWVWAGTPGWLGNIAIIQPRQTVYGLGNAFVDPLLPDQNPFVPWYNMWSTPLVMHFTVGAAFDPDVLANGGIQGNGNGQLACLEPGFDVNNFLAHDLDIYDPPNADAAAAIQFAEDNGVALVQQIADALPVGDLVTGALGAALGAANQGTDVVFEPRAEEEAYYPEDNSGALVFTSSSAPDCLDERGDHNNDIGKIETASGETVTNNVGIRVNQDLGVVGAAPFRDPVETALVPGDTHENAGGGPQLYFTGALTEDSDTKTDVALYDGFYDVGEGCGTFGDFGNTCMGDEMLKLGYRDPTGLVFVFRGTGPITFMDWDSLNAGFIWAEHADTNLHCVIGASPKVFNNGGQDLDKTQVFEAILTRAAPGTSLDGLTQTEIKEALRTTLCDGAATLEYFPGPGFRQHEQGGSLGNPFGWQWAPSWGGATSATLDVYYVISVDENSGLEKDKLGLKDLTVGSPTVVNTDDGSVTMVWQDRVEMGSQT